MRRLRELRAGSVTSVTVGVVVGINCLPTHSLFLCYDKPAKYQCWMYIA